MNNVTVIKDEHTNIQEVAVKKIKLKGDDFKNLQLEGEKYEVEKSVEVKEEVVEEKKEIEPVKEKIEVKEKEVPSYVPNYNDDSKDYVIDEEKLKEKIAGNYGNLVSHDKKVEKKPEEEKPKKISEVEFEKLLQTSLTIMSPKMKMFEKVYNEKHDRLTKAKAEQSRLADLFQKLSGEEQVAKSLKETIEKRLELMNKKELFAYLDGKSGEDNSIVEAASLVDEALKNYFNVNKGSLKELIGKLEQLDSQKKKIDNEEKQVRSEISAASTDLNKYMTASEPLLNEMIKIDSQYQDAEKETDKAIKQEYEALVDEEKIGEEVQVNSLETEEQVSVSNAMENFKKVTAVTSNGEMIIGNNNQEEIMNSRRVA